MTVVMIVLPMMMTALKIIATVALMVTGVVTMPVVMMIGCIHLVNILIPITIDD